MAMDDLAQWLSAQLDEDERLARAAASQRGGGEWTAEPDATGIVAVVGRHQPHEAGFPGVPEILNPDDDETAEHIAEHDPARVLREVDAKRRLLADYAAEVQVVERGHRSGWTEGGQAVREHLIKVWAAIYDQRPGYRPEWRP